MKALILIIGLTLSYLCTKAQDTIRTSSVLKEGTFNCKHILIKKDEIFAKCGCYDVYYIDSCTKCALLLRVHKYIKNRNK